MTNIDVKRIGTFVQLKIENPNVEPLFLKFPAEAALQVGAAMIGCVDTQMVRPLLDFAPMTLLHNPRFEIRQTDTRQTVLMFFSDKMRPILIKIDKEHAAAFAEELSGASALAI